MFITYLSYNGVQGRTIVGKCRKRLFCLSLVLFAKLAIMAKLANLVNRGNEMKTMTATEAQNNFGDLLMSVQSEPVSITRNGKEKGVLLSATAYQEIKQQALQQAITDGIESGEPSPLDMADIKNKARQRMGLDVKD